MGNIDSRCHHDSGYMYLQTSQPFYYPGTFVTGTIYLRLSRPVEARHVELQIKGKEKGSFLDTEYHQEERNGQQVQVARTVKRKKERTIFNFSAPCFTFSSPVLAPGDYAIPFTFQVPSHLPSSLMYKNHHHAKKPQAKVKYHIRALLHGHHGSVMKYKQVLILREVPPQQEAQIKQTSEHQITTCCCMNQGTSKIEVTFERNTFEPHEKCKADVHLDNSHCNVALTHVRLAVEQELEIDCGSHRFRETFVLTDDNEEGVGPQQEGHKNLDVDLGKIKYAIERERTKKGSKKAMSPEDYFMITQMQPVCNSPHITNKYFLTVRCTFQGCTCCAGLPHAKIPLTIVPVVNPACYGFQQPVDFVPHQYDQYQCTIVIQQ